MHFIVSWDVKAIGEREKEIDTALANCLKGYSWVRPLKDFYIVRIESNADWDKIVQAMVEVGRQYKGEVNFIFSPVMQGGSYNGWLPKTMWDKIRERAKE